MAVDDLSSRRELNDLQRRVRRLESGTPLYSSSVTEGRLRFIGGLLRVDSGGRVEIEGTLQVDGTTEVTGTFNLTGPWEISGNGEITGTVGITGDLEVNGPWTLVGDGDITGDVDVTGDINVISGGRIKAGAITLNPTASGGSVSFGTGRSIHAGSGFLGIYDGDSFIAFNAGGVSLSGGGPVVAVGEDLKVLLLDTATSVSGLSWLAVDGSGKVWKVNPSTGGPSGSGDFQWPFSLSSVSREYGPGYEEYDDGIHKGIDFGVGAGTPIPAAGAGTVAVNSFDSERGNYVILDHGTIGGYAVTTRYYHLQSASPLAVDAVVTKGQTIGLVGSTGLSTGPHLHFETRRDGEHMNPRTFMSLYGE